MSNILLVDDDKVLHETLTVVLKAAQHVVTSAYDADSAQLLIQSEHFHVAVVDQMLPGPRTGVDFINENRHRNMSFILLTAFASQQVIQSAWAAGAVETFKKPVPLDLFADTVSIACQIQRSVPYTGSINLDSLEAIANETTSSYPQLVTETLEDMRGALGPDLPLNLVYLLKEQCSNDLNLIMSYQKTQDFKAASDLSHRLAGALVNFGLQRAEMLARRMHFLASDCNPALWTEVEILRKELNSSIQVAEGFLRAS